MTLATFPITLTSRLTGGPQFSTDIIVGSNASEVRNANWQDALWRWNASSSIRTRADAYTLYTFFLTHMGRETTFLVQDPFDYKIPQTGSTFQTIGTGNGATLTFQLSKLYTDASSNTYTRNIYRPSSGVAVKVNNVLQTVTVDYSISTTTGIVTFVVAPPNGHLVTVTQSLFYVLARFDIDTFPNEILMWDSTTDYSLLQLPEIPMTEVRE